MPVGLCQRVSGQSRCGLLGPAGQPQPCLVWICSSTRTDEPGGTGADPVGTGPFGMEKRVARPNAQPHPGAMGAKRNQATGVAVYTASLGLEDPTCTLTTLVG